LWDHHVASRGTIDSRAEVEQVIARPIGKLRVPERPISGMSARSAVDRFHSGCIGWLIIPAVGLYPAWQ
jgi:hypothetical protein